MQTELENIRSILSENLTEEQVQNLVSRLTLALGNGSVAIAGNVSDTVILTVNGDNNTFTICKNTDLGEIESLLRKLQLESTQRSLMENENEFNKWRIEQNKHFLDSLKSKNKSRVTFKQVINFKDESTKFIERKALFSKLDCWYSSWNDNTEMLVVTGGEGDGKTWGITYWLEQKIQSSENFPPVFFLPSSAEICQDPLDSLCEIITRRSSLSIDDCKDHLKNLINKPTPHKNPPIFLITLDGINEHHKFPQWQELINSLNASPWRGKVALLITCRKEYWKRSAPRHLQETTWNLDSYNEEELTEALKIHNLSRSEISQELLNLLCKPRYFDLARVQIEKAGNKQTR
jgi:hypothetical protein